MKAITRYLESPAVFTLPIAACFTFITLAVFGQTRPSDSEISSELRAISEQHSAMVRELSAMSQHVTDLEKLIDLRRAELDSLDPSKYTERLARIEDTTKRYDEEKKADAQAAQARWDSLFVWLRSLSIGLVGFVAHEFWRRYQDKIRHAVIATQVEEQTKTIDRLEKNTNSKMDRLLKVTGEAEKAKGVIEGIEQSK